MSPPLLRLLRRELVTCLLVLLCPLATVSACSKPRHQPSDAGSRPTAANETTVIRFSDPGNAGVLAFARRERILDAELAKVGARIEWVPAAGAFSANFEAMNAGAINASSAAVSPIIGALAHNLKFKIFAIGNPSGVRQAGIIVPGDSNVRTVKDLVGKRVAVNLAAHGDYLLLKALANANVPAASVERVAIQPPDAAAAFATGKLDGWSTFGVFFTTATRNGARVLAYESDLVSDDLSVSAASAETLQQNPAAFRVLLRVMQDLTREANAHPERFQNVFTDKGPTALSGDRLAAAIEETRELAVPRVPTADDRARIGRVARLFVDNRSIDREVPVDEIVYDIDGSLAAKGASR